MPSPSVKVLHMKPAIDEACGKCSPSQKSSKSECVRLARPSTKRGEKIGSASSISSGNSPTSKRQILYHEPPTQGMRSLLAGSYYHRNHDTRPKSCSPRRQDLYEQRFGQNFRMFKTSLSSREMQLRGIRTFEAEVQKKNETLTPVDGSPRRGQSPFTPAGLPGDQSRRRPYHVPGSPRQFTGLFSDCAIHQRKFIPEQDAAGYVLRHDKMTTNAVPPPNPTLPAPETEKRRLGGANGISAFRGPQVDAEIRMALSGRPLTESDPPIRGGKTQFPHIIGCH